MCTKFEMKFNHGLKSVDFKMEGFGEEASVNLINKIMRTITESGNSKSKIKIPTIQNQKIDVPEIPKERQTNIFEFEKHVIEENTPQEEITEENIQEEPSTIFNSDNEMYQTYYICKCGDKGKHKIKRSQIYVNCWKCGKRMRVRDAHIEGFPLKDDYGNTFIAGEFKRADQAKYGAMVY